VAAVRDPLELLDNLVAGLPPAGTSDYAPVATLTAIALVLGDQIIATNEGTSWVPGSEAMAVLFALKAGPDAYFRPVDYMMSAWRDGLPSPVTRYAELASVRLRQYRAEPSP
jgi:hypothetical protein